jgi:hypothetical protein
VFGSLVTAIPTPGARPARNVPERFRSIRVVVAMGDATEHSLIVIASN